MNFVLGGQDTKDYPSAQQTHISSPDLSGANRCLLSRHRWLAMDHSKCNVCNCGMPDGQVFHWDTTVNMLTQRKRNSPNSPPQIELLEEKKMNCLREMTGREAKVMLEPGPHGESCSLPACAGLSFSIS